MVICALAATAKSASARVRNNFFIVIVFLFVVPTLDGFRRPHFVREGAWHFLFKSAKLHLFFEQLTFFYFF